MGGFDIAADIRCDGGLGILPSLQPTVFGGGRQELPMCPLLLLLLHSVSVPEACRTAVYGARGSIENTADTAGWGGGWGGTEEEGDGFVESDEEYGGGANELCAVSQVQDGDRKDGGMQ